MAVTARNYSSVAITTTLSSLINSSVTSFTVAASTGWPAAPFIAVLEANTVNEEIVLVGAAAGTSWSSITRGYDSSPAVSHSAGAAVQHMVVGIDFREAQNHAVSTTSNVHNLGASSSVVGTLDSQTLTNKTLTTPTLNSPVLTNAGNPLTLPSTTDTLVGRATTDTLTNKTLTTPVITGSGGTLSLPAGPDTLAGIGSTQTLTNKTLTSPTISAPAFSGTPTGSLTNLALTTPAITGSGGALTLPAGPTTIIGASTTPSGNLLENPSFRVDQRNGIFGFPTSNADIVTRGNHVADRWRYAANGTTTTTFSLDSGVSAGINFSSGSYAYWTIATNNASMAQLQQRSNELFHWLNNKTVTFSMSGFSPFTVKLNITYTVNYGTGGSPSAPQTFTVGSVTIPNTSTTTRVSASASIAEYVSGKTFGTNFDAYGQLNIEWDQTNSNGAYLLIGDVQFETGALATNFVSRPFGQELALCNRHLFVLGGNPQPSATFWYQPFYQVNSVILRSDVIFPAPMRKAPSISSNVTTNSGGAPAAYTQFGITQSAYNSTIALTSWGTAGTKMTGGIGFTNIVRPPYHSAYIGTQLTLNHSGAGFTVGTMAYGVFQDGAYFMFSAEL